MRDLLMCLDRRAYEVVLFLRVVYRTSRLMPRAFRQLYDVEANGLRGHDEVVQMFREGVTPERMVRDACAREGVVYDSERGRELLGHALEIQKEVLG